MTRILADLPEEDIRWLDGVEAQQGRSRASVLRAAVQAYRQGSEGEGIEQFFGIWAERKERR